MDRKVGGGVQGVEEKIHKRTSVSSIRFRQKMRLEVDTLDYIMGGVLFMECEDGK